jgi:uncharacterized NAD(P)/FAD-binding protein YdhS
MRATRSALSMPCRSPAFVLSRPRRSDAGELINSAAVWHEPNTVATNVTIVGGGAAGLLTALHLLRKPSPGLRIRLIEKGARVGDGIAYATRRPEHLLNVVAGRMSAFDDDPDHFVRYLQRHATGGETHRLGEIFAERRVYSAYLRDSLQQAATGSSLDIVHDEVLALNSLDGFQLTLRSGQTLPSDAVVLALGNWPRTTLRAMVPEAAAERLFLGWDYDATAAVGADEAVCIVGTGLSMVDAVLTLSANGHRGAIDVVSRHALMPLPHTPQGRIAFDLDAFAKLPLIARIRLLRSHALEAQRAGMPWQWLMDTLRSHSVQAWQTLSVQDQRRFLRHAARYWDVHRHRIPAAVDQRLNAMQGSGQLRLHRGRPCAIAWRDQRFEITVDHHGARQILQADRVIDCTGMQPDIRRVSDPLVRAMLDGGLLRRGAHGIGLDTDATGTVVAADGTVQQQLYAIGSVRRGQLWESIAVPELRQQAAALAGRIVGDRDKY